MAKAIFAFTRPLKQTVKIKRVNTLAVDFSQRIIKRNKFGLQPIL